MKIELSKAVNYQAGSLKEIDLDLESLTGYDVIGVENELRAAGVSVAAWEYSREFLLALASKAAGLPVEVLKGLSIGDFTKIINEMLIFLAGTGSATATEKNTGE